MARRKTIKLNPVEHETLSRLYEARLLGTDRYMHRRDELRDLTATFNALTGRNDSPEEVLHYMQTKRRTKNAWPTLDGNHRRVPVVLGNLVDPDHIPVLQELFIEIGQGVETIGQDRDLMLNLERRFEEITGVRKRGYALATAMLELRKEGNLPTLEEREEDGFDDFDAAEDAG